jgi:hypothetical protein
MRRHRHLPPPTPITTHQLVRDKSQLAEPSSTPPRQAVDSAYTHRADPDLALEEAERAIFAATHRIGTPRKLGRTWATVVQVGPRA